MPIPPLFIPGTNILSKEAAKFFRDLYQAQLLARFIKYPIKPYPAPITDPRFKFDPEPEVSFEGMLYGDVLTNAVAQSPINKDSFNLVDALKREKVMVNALEELSQQLEMAQKHIQSTLKDLS